MPRPPNLQVRSRLLAAGRELFHKNGFNGCGVNEITTAAAIPKGSFYAYFASKEELAVEVILDYWRRVEDVHGQHLSDSGVLPIKRVERFFKGLVSDHESRGFTYGCLVGNEALELAGCSEPARLAVRDVFHNWEKRIEDCLREATEFHGPLADVSPAERAAILIEGYEGAVMRSLAEHDWLPCRRFLKIVLPAHLNS